MFNKILIANRGEIAVRIIRACRELGVRTFAKMCERCSVTFIGPSAHAMELMGDKARAKDTMKKAGVPVIPGSDGVVRDIGEAKAVAAKIGYPVMVKASAGGGGRGIRLVPDEAPFLFWGRQHLY